MAQVRLIVIDWLNYHPLHPIEEEKQMEFTKGIVPSWLIYARNYRVR